MRNPKKITRILKKVEKLWKKYPDLRLGQLIMNLAYDNIDPYYMEDKKLETRIDTHIK